MTKTEDISDSKGVHTPLMASVLLMWAVLYIIFPHYQYYIDPDGTSYLTISRRYAEGDLLKAVNGLWSPWACWLTALLMRVGLQPVPASVVVNAAAATGFLCMAHSFFIRFRIETLSRWVLCFALVVFLCFAVFWQSFDDLWQCFFLLCILRIMIVEGFIARPLLWLCIGAIGALAYFAKAYSLPFFVLNTVCCTWILSGKSLIQTIKVAFVSITVIVLCSLPWMYALHSKYGIWTTSTAGAMNMSWYLVGHPEWKKTFDILLPPAYPDSPYYWEDPYFFSGHISHFWDSWHLFVRQVLKFGLNCFSLLVCMVQLSVVFPLIGLLILSRLFLKRRFSALTKPEQLLHLTILMLPAGYILVHLESRYIWYMVVPGMVIGALFLQNFQFRSASMRKLAMLVFCVSFIVYPAWHLGTMYEEGKQEYDFAKKLNVAGFKEIDFVSNLHPRLLSKIAYFSGNRFYTITKQRAAEPASERDIQKGANTLALLKDIDRYHVKYYLHAPAGNSKMKNTGFYDIFYENLRDSTGTMYFAPVFSDTVSGITLYKLR